MSFTLLFPGIYSLQDFFLMICISTYLSWIAYVLLIAITDFFIELY